MKAPDTLPTRPAHAAPRRFGFVMEQTLGHVTHYRNLRAAVDCVDDVCPTWLPLAFAPRGAVETLPVLRHNWSARAGTRARRLLRREQAVRRFDALYFHTQVTSLLCVPVMRRVPSVISLDATPRNYDQVGSAYGHSVASSPVEAIKDAANARALRAAGALVTWCAWARDSLVRDYGVDSRRITVIPPGVNLARWPRPSSRAMDGPVKILFVGADFARKGGDMLLRAFQDTLRGRCELHLVTKSPIEPGEGIYVYRSLAPNSEELMHLYAGADLFVLPTLADCLPLVIQEAMAAGLPVISTAVGAIPEAVIDGKTGYIVAPGDGRALAAALAALIDDSTVRGAMGGAARMLAEQRYDSAANARRILDIMTDLSDRRECAQTRV